MSSIDETALRRRVLAAFAGKVSGVADALILTGSLAYGADVSVTKDSDIDVILVSSDFNAVMPFIAPSLASRSIPEKYYFEALCLSTELEDIKISVHVMPLDTLRFIALSYVADLRVYRPLGKAAAYDLRSFRGASKKFDIKNIKLIDGMGYRTIVPVGFIEKDEYFVGIYRDKLLCMPEVVYDCTGEVERLIAANWARTLEIFRVERNRLGSEADLTKALVKYGRFSPAAKNHVSERVAALARGR